MNRFSKGVAVLATLMTTAACATAAEARPPVRNATPIAGSAPRISPNPMAAGFTCLNQMTNQAVGAGYAPPRIAVGKVQDFTGKFSNEASEGGFRVTQGGALMVISALGKIDSVRIIERLDTQVADIDMLLAKTQLLRDPTSVAGQSVVRDMVAGQYEGSDYYIVGGITEVNYNIRSGGAEFGVQNVGFGRRTFVMNIVADLRIVETKSLTVVKTIPVEKQIRGYETKAGIFSFFGGDYLVDINAGDKANEPIQQGVRAALEYGTLELVAAVTPGRAYYGEQCRPYVENVFGQ